MIDAFSFSDKLREIILSCQKIDESSILDYKLQPHDTVNHLCEFLKDIISLLNSSERPSEDRFLVYGIEDKKRIALGYDFGTALDNADYQNLFSKISPRPTIEFHAVDASAIVDGIEPGKKQFACFYIPAENFGEIYEIADLTIDAEYGNRRKFRRYEAGTSFTREGSRVRSLIQADRDKMRATKIQPSFEAADRLPPSFDSHGLATDALAAILGSWDEGNENDRRIIAEASGESYDDWASSLRIRASANPRVFVLNGTVWEINQRNDLLTQNGGNISPSLLDNLKPIIIQVLCTPNSKFDLDPDLRFAAVLYGKGPAYSQQIRKGLAEFLAIIGNKCADLPNCSSRYINGLIWESESSVFLSTDWKVLASASDLFPLFSEASPSMYLNLVRQAFEKKNVLSEYLAQEESGLGVGRYGSRLFLGIRYAARAADFFAESMSLLMDLHSMSPLADSAIEGILLPWHPQTGASVKSRSSMGKNLIDAGCWESLLKLLPSMTTTMISLPEPTYLAVDPSSDNVTLEDFWEVSRAYVGAAIIGSFGSLDRSRALIESMHSIIGAGCIGDFMSQLEETCLNLTELGRLRIWGDLKNYLAKCEKYADAAWVPGDGDKQAIITTLEAIKPEGTFFDALHLFSYDDFELIDDEDWKRGQEKLKTFRIAALERLYEDEGREGIACLVHECLNVETLGIYFAKCSFASDLQDVVLEKLTGDDDLGHLAKGFVRGIYEVQGGALLSIPEESDWPLAKSIAFYAALPCEKLVWEAAERTLGEDVSSYWEKAPSCNKVDSVEDADHIIGKCNEAGRFDEAILLAYNCIKEGLTVDPFLVFDSIKQYTPVDARCPEVHFIPEICRYLEGRLPSIDLARLEFRIFPLLGHDKRGLYLFKLMSSDPDFFMTILSSAYGSKENESHDEGSKAATSRARTVLWEWRELPGLTSEGLDEDRFSFWINKVMEAAATAGLSDRAEKVVGECAFHAPQDDSGLFINETVANYLDSSPHALKGYSNESLNSRGPVSVDGTGKAHYVAAEVYNKRAEQLEGIGLINFAATARQISRNIKADGIIEEEEGIR